MNITFPIHDARRETPAESVMTLVFCGSEPPFYSAVVPYSRKHNKFNAHDFDRADDIAGEFDDVRIWANMKDVERAVQEVLHAY